MRGTLLLVLPSCVRGRQALLARLRRLVLAAYRFDAHRARTPEDRQFSARLLDGLRRTLAEIDPAAPRFPMPACVSHTTTDASPPGASSSLNQRTA